MKIKNFLLIGALAITALSSTSVVAQQGGVAVVDVDAVAREIGADKEVLGALKQAQDNLNTKLKDAQATMQKQFDAAVAKAGGDKATNEQKQQLAQFNRQLQSQFAQYKGQAQVALNREQAKRVLAIRELIRPVAMEVAKAKGLSVVLQKSEQILGFQESSDITKAVAAKLKATMPAKAKAAPKATPKASPAKATKKK
ncbi:MAG: OmpH family outer membrane protein [Verrucomicrobiales bacterium]|nr:OmpH family outer membrane protein [Verrucomicrobiales bacterium]